MAGVPEGLISDLVTKGVDGIAFRKKRTSQNLDVLLLHQESGSTARMEKGVAEIVNELREMRWRWCLFLVGLKIVGKIMPASKIENTGIGGGSP